MDEVVVIGKDLDEEQRRAFRRAAGKQGVEAVVEWQGHPHMVTKVEPGREGDEFTLEPIPRPFG